MWTPENCTDEQDADYRVLCCLAKCAGVNPSDSICPNIERIAATNGSLQSKANRLERELQRNVRERQSGGHLEA